MYISYGRLFGGIDMLGIIFGLNSKNGHISFSKSVRDVPARPRVYAVQSLN